jgi:RNA polymerase sigma-70 factor (TIGR02960 family)
VLTQRQFAERTERHRHELRVHCYRMLASFEDAEDLVQETLLRAWRRRDDLDREEHFRAWLYKIATNACLDTIKNRKRRVPSLHSFRDLPWLEPYPDRLLDVAAPDTDQPDVALIGRETIELTFLAVIQVLTPRQRAVLILREVLKMPAAEVAELLEISVPAVNSALQRARATLREHLPTGHREHWPSTAVTEAEQEILARYIAAQESGDAEATLELIRDDIRVTMPPAPLLFEGRAAVLGLARRAATSGEWRLLPTRANRQPAAACYLRDSAETEFRAFKIDVLRVVDGAIAEATTFGVKHFPAFGLPAVLPSSGLLPASASAP